MPDPVDQARCVRCHRRHSPDRHVGAPVGHKGHQVKWKPDERIRARVKKCKCGRKKLRKLNTISKMCIDYDGNRRVAKIILYLLEERYCSRCDLVITAPDPCIPGTSIGKKLASHIVSSAGDSDRYSSIVNQVRKLTNRKFAENTIRNCVQAVVENSLQSSMPEIMEELRKASFIQIDETHMPVNGKRGYVWLVRIDKATFIVVTTTRSGDVIPTFFEALIGKYAVTDGYVVYPKFMEVQRCWSHELRQAEKLAIDGGVGSLHDKLFDELRHIYYIASVLAIKGGATDEQIEQLKGGVRAVIVKYGDRPIAGRLTRALDSLFVALSVPGMYLHNNHTEADIRKVVIYRNLHHQIKTPRGGNIFSVLYSFVQTAIKNGMFSDDAILNKLNDPSWSLFDDSSGAPTPREPEPHYRTPSDAERAKIERYKARYNTVRSKKTSDTTKPTVQEDLKTEDGIVPKKQDRYYPVTCIIKDTIPHRLALRSRRMALVLVAIIISMLGGIYLALLMTATGSLKFQYIWRHAQTTYPSQQPWPPHAVSCHTKPTRAQRSLHPQILAIPRTTSGSWPRRAQTISA